MELQYKEEVGMVLYLCLLSKTYRHHQHHNGRNQVFICFHPLYLPVQSLLTFTEHVQLFFICMTDLLDVQHQKLQCDM